MPNYAYVNWVDALAYVVFGVFIVATIVDVVCDHIVWLEKHKRSR